MSTYTIIISDQNTPKERELTAALQQSTDIAMAMFVFVIPAIRQGMLRLGKPISPPNTPPERLSKSCTNLKFRKP